jgi:DNA-directed RNA polymerase specialized sigma24 family protein
MRGKADPSGGQGQVVKAGSSVPPSIFSQLLQEALRAARKRSEAEDLFQTVWLAAVEAGRDDLSCAANRRWFVGALRRRALFDARTAVRRRTREQRAALMEEHTGQSAEVPVRFVERLPPKLRTTALLVLTGHNKREILWLLRMNEPALRQRIADIRRRWRAESGGSLDGVTALSGPLNFGIIRRALLPPARNPDVMLASHDPDGHLFVVSTSRKAGARQLDSGSNRLEE